MIPGCVGMLAVVSVFLFHQPSLTLTLCVCLQVQSLVERGTLRRAQRAQVGQQQHGRVLGRARADGHLLQPHPALWVRREWGVCAVDVAGCAPARWLTASCLSAVLKGPR